MNITTIPGPVDGFLGDAGAGEEALAAEALVGAVGGAGVTLREAGVVVVLLLLGVPLVLGVSELMAERAARISMSISVSGSLDSLVSRENTPFLASHWKYRIPPTLPSFLPV